MDAREEAELAAWLLEAFETGNALAPLPATHLPTDADQGERVAARVLDGLGLPVCGLRLAPEPGPDASGRFIAGPMLESRLLSPSTPIAIAALRHAQATAAIVAVLAEPLCPGVDAPPVLAALHPAIDVAAGRLRAPHASAALCAADLGGLGLVVVGRRARARTGASDVPVTLAIRGRRPRPHVVDLRSQLAAGAAAARRMGGLPAGAILVLAGLSAPIAPEIGMHLSAGCGPLGRVTAHFA